MTVEQFSSELLTALSNANIFKSISLSTEGPQVKGRAYLTDSKFLSYYYNEQTGTIAFALIEGINRIWGIDRKKLLDWHLHPIDNSELHVAIEPLSVSEIISRLVDLLSNQP